MAINYSVTYSFAPNTVISSAQVNTDFTDNANTWNGLEALTKTFAKLKVDVDPGSALEVATKQYVDHYANYRRPRLVYTSATTISLETGLDGTTGTGRILFPDGTLRSDSTSSHIVLDVSRVAALTGSKQSGIRTGTIGGNTWQAIYAVQAQDNTTDFVLVADVIQHSPSNFSTLNTRFGVNGWVYLGSIPYGDNAGATTAFPKFVQTGNAVWFNNQASGASQQGRGILAASATAVSLTYSYVAGTSVPQVPGNILLGTFTVCMAAASGNVLKVLSGDSNIPFSTTLTSAALASVIQICIPLQMGILLANTGASSTTYDIFLNNYWDNALGVGPNPML